MNANFQNYIKAVIFDLDGTLVRSSLDFTRMRADIGCPPEQDVLSFVAGLGRGKKEHAEAIIYLHEMEDADTVELIPGAASLLGELRASGLSTGIVTRNSLAATARKLSHSDLSVERVLTRDCAPPKPDPSALLQLCDEWQIQPYESVYVGDYLYDLQAAKNAGMHSCLYASEVLPDYADQASFVCRRYDDFIDQLNRFVAA